VSDRIYKSTGRLRLARCSVLVVGMGGSLAFLLPMISVGDPLTAVWLLTGSFFFLEITNPVLWTLPLDIAGKYAGTAGGMMNTGFGIAGMISPVAFGYLIEHTGSYNAPFMVSAGLLALGLVAALFIDTARTVEADEEREREEGPAARRAFAAPAAAVVALSGRGPVTRRRRPVRAARPLASRGLRGSCRLPSRQS
jgi:MFS family permease